MDEARGRWRAVASAFAVDRPWGDVNSRRTVFLTALLAGLLGGGVEGAMITHPWLGMGESFGDASFWDTVAGGAWIGAGAGAAAGFALILSRSLAVRVTLSALCGALLVPAAMAVSSSGYPVGNWEPRIEASSLLAGPAGWGLYLGGPVAATLAVVLHLSRCAVRGPTLRLAALAWSLFIGARSQGFFWSEWDSVRPILHCSTGVPPVQSWAAGMIPAFSAWLLVLIVTGTSRRIRPRTLSLLLGGATAVLGIAVALAARTMWLTGPSGIDDLAFTPDGESLITAHRANVLRRWSIEGQEPGGTLSLKERECRRLVHRSAWRLPLTLRPPFVACVDDREIRLWDLATGRRFTTLNLPGSGWMGPAFSADAKTIGVFNSSEILVGPVPEPGSAASVDFAASVRASAIRTNASRGGRLWISPSGEPFLTRQTSASFVPGLDSRSSGLHLTRTLATLSDDTEILIAAGMGKTYIWNAGRIGTLLTLEPPMGEIRWTRASSDDQLVGVATAQDLWILDAQRGKVLVHEPADRPLLYQVAASSDGRWIAAVVDGGLRIWRRPPHGI